VQFVAIGGRPRGLSSLGRDVNLAVCDVLYSATCCCGYTTNYTAFRDNAVDEQSDWLHGSQNASAPDRQLD